MKTRRTFRSYLTINIVHLLLVATALLFIVDNSRSDLVDVRMKSSSDPVHNGVHVIGDSITYRAHEYENSPLRAELRPEYWSVDSFAGRKLQALDADYIAPTDDWFTAVHHVFRPDPVARIGTAVIAIGTNVSPDEFVTAERAEYYYRAQIRKLREKNMWHYGPKKIVLVTPWKDHRVAEGEPFITDPTRVYNWAQDYRRNIVNRQAIQEIARTTTNVCVMPWHRYAMENPERLRDGVHPDATGVQVWKQMLFEAIRSC